MGAFARYLRARGAGKGGGVNVVKDPKQKKKFQAEIEEMLDPVAREEMLQRNHETLILKSQREPTVKEVLEFLAKQCVALRKRRPGVPLDCYCGAYAMALLAKVRSYPEDMLGLQIHLDRFIPPWDVVVMFRDHKGKRHGGIL